MRQELSESALGRRIALCKSNQQLYSDVHLFQGLGGVRWGTGGSCTQMLTHAIAHRGCKKTVRVGTESFIWLWENSPMMHQGTEPLHDLSSNLMLFCM